jgi:PAS domain S-box-containing protein
MDPDLSRVVDALPGLVWTALPDGHIDFLNQRWCEYTGLDQVEACGDGWRAAIHPDDLPDLLRLWRAILAAGEPGEMEARLRRFDGAYRWFLFKACPIGGASGQIVKWCGINTDIDDRKQTEEALLAHERRFHMIIDGFPALVTLRAPSGDLKFANREAVEYSGATFEELQARSWDDAWHPDDRSPARAAWIAALETGQPLEFEGRRRGADGAYRWFHVHGFPLRETDGFIVLWSFLHTDVDDRRRAEALLEGEKRLLEMVASGRPLPVVLDALCELVDVTAVGCSSSVLLLDRARTRIRYAAAPGLPLSYREFLKGRSVAYANGPCGMAMILKTAVLVSDVATETRWDSNGWPALAQSYGVKSCWSAPIFSLTGELLGTFAITRREPGNPTPFHQALIEQFTHIASIAIERAENEGALRQSEAFLTEAQRLSSTGSFSWSVAADEITPSEQLCRIYEFDPALPVTLDLIHTRIHPQDLPAVLELIARQRGGRDYEHEYRLLMPDQRTKYVREVGCACRDQNGESEYITVLQDVTQRRLSEEALAKAQSELAHVARVTTLGALTASIAHEVNQPLSGIITNAGTCLRMLAADPPNVAGARETARRTIRDGNRASEVVTRLRALFAKQSTATDSVDLNEAAREVIALSRSELRRGQVIPREELADDLPNVAGDRVQLQQVILNLLLNASDAMSGVDDRPRQLIIKTEREDSEHVRLTVQDTGVGFEPQGAEKLFEAFYTTKSSGMGIGLSVSRSIIESHHGRLWATPNDGPGASFAFSIPREPEASADADDSNVNWIPVTTDAEHVMRNL